MDLVERWEDVVGELHLSDWPHSLCCCAYGEAYQALLAQWCVEDTVCAEVCSEVHGASEHASELDVFAKHKDAFVGLQCMAEGFVDGCVEVDALCLAFPDMLWKLWICECRFGCVM